MTALKKVYLQISVLILLVANSCSYISDIGKEYNWVETSNGIKCWYFSDEEASLYHWSGSTWNNFAHGNGLFTVYDKDNNVITQENVTAYYGALYERHIKNLSDGKYVGEIFEDEMYGFGVLIKNNNEIFAGQFENSIPNGFLDWYVNNKLNYSGYWVNGLFDGEGIFYKDETETAGVWKGGKIHEKMIELEDSLGYYCGYFANGKFKGYLNVHTDALSYEGDFFEDYPEGFGIALFEDGSYYSGNWEKGKRNGHGDFLYPNDEYYSGDWVNDLQDGYGSYYFANGDSYVGQWKNGLQHGEGKYESSNFIYVGNWEEGWMNGEGRMDYPNGDYYEGNFVENQRYGVGAYHSVTGNVYEGEFVDNVYNGLGTYYFSDGSIYEGEFEDGKIKGDGTFYCVVDNDTLAITAFWDGSGKFPENVSILFSSGEIYEGTIVNGKLSPDGSWYTTEDVSNDSKEKLKGINNKVKKVNATIDKVTTLIRVVHLAATIGSFIPVVNVIAAPIACVTTALMPVVNVVDAANIAFTVGSTATDVYLERENMEELLKDGAIDVGINVATIVVSKVIERKAKIRLSKSVAKKTIKNSEIKIVKSSPLKSVVKVTKDADGQLTKKLATSKLSTIAHRVTGKKSHQFVSSKQYRKALSKNPELKNKITKGVEANGGTLRKNMELISGKKMTKRNLREAKLSKMHGAKRAEAHHVVPGNSKKAQRARDILKCCNIDINDPRNGIMLPQSPKSIHKGTIHGHHVSEYDDLVVQMLENMLKKNGGKCNESACEKVLDNIKIDLYKGNVELLRNHRANKTFRTIAKRK